MISAFLYATDLDATGLGDSPSERFAWSFPSLKFRNKIVNFGAALPLHAGASGVWWDLANTLREVTRPDHGPISVNGKSVTKVDPSDWGIKLHVWEVSTCDPGKGSCEPGYANDPGVAVLLRAGIRPELCFEVVLTYNGYHYSDYFFTVPYDAIVWTETQWDLQGVLKT
jgi:hypothetical protein